ncbi:MAG: glutamate-5-semialdehyde dehydrogenase [Ruminococcaceae bacterium]|nr:glutamate-5-semialdehyde dehydrogenase [Oscillospiraceae bacterium]
MIFEKVKEICERAKAASPAVASSKGNERNAFLSSFARLLVENTEELLLANGKDIESAAAAGISTAMLDRLRLTDKRIVSLSEGITALIGLSDPLGGGEVFTRPNGMEIKKIKVPLGVCGVIFEARPNVAADIAALCIKSGNAAVLRGGRECINTNLTIEALAKKALAEAGLPGDAVCLIPFTEREGANALMQMRGLVDVLIPRGGKGLIKSVTENSSVPVIETGAGNCHIYVHSDADFDLALSVIRNAKVSRPSVCNAIETVLVNGDVAADFLPRLKEIFDCDGVEIRGCEKTREIIECTPATEDDWEREYNDLICAVKVVACENCAVSHINRYGTGHSEAIITESRRSAELFCTMVDAACVYVNASTRFTDGGQFGFGAEVGISTQKLHARGPMGLSALTTDKYIISGNGQIRE